jgi:hypothetical protein
MSAHDMADAQSAEMQLIVINAPHSIRSNAASTGDQSRLSPPLCQHYSTGVSCTGSASGGIDNNGSGIDDDDDSAAQRCFAHWWTVAAHALYLALVAAVGWRVSFRTMAILVAVLTPLRPRRRQRRGRDYGARRPMDARATDRRRTDAAADCRVSGRSRCGDVDGRQCSVRLLDLSAVAFSFI